MRTHLLAAAAALALTASCTDADAQRVDWTMVQNRVWIERMPKDARDMIKQLVLIDDEGQRAGAAVHASRFRYLIDVVAWDGKGDALRMFFLQTRQEYRATVRAWNCTGKAPEPFELCLELQDKNGGKRMFFSKKDWVIEGLADAEAVHRTLTTDDGAREADEDATPSPAF